MRRPGPLLETTANPLPVAPVVLSREPAHHPAPDKSAQVGEGRLGYPVPEVVGPAPQQRIEAMQQELQGLVQRLLTDGPDPGLHRRQRALARVGVHVPLGRASLLLPPDAEAKEVEALIDVSNPVFGIVRSRTGRGWNAPDRRPAGRAARNWSSPRTTET